MIHWKVIRFLIDEEIVHLIPRRAPNTFFSRASRITRAPVDKMNVLFIYFITFYHNLKRIELTNESFFLFYIQRWDTYWSSEQKYVIFFLIFLFFFVINHFSKKTRIFLWLHSFFLWLHICARETYVFFFFLSIYIII